MNVWARRRRLPLIALGAAVVTGATVLSTATGAQAATTAGTTTTFSVNGGALAITAPASTNVGSGAAGASITAALGAVTVTDARGLLTASWTASASTTSFTTGGGTPAETVGATEVSYWSGPATANTGIGVLTPGQLTALLAQSLGTSKTAFTLTLGVGNNSVTWNPTVIVAVPSAAIAGTYTGTITHSVA